MKARSTAGAMKLEDLGSKQLADPSDSGGPTIRCAGLWKCHLQLEQNAHVETQRCCSNVALLPKQQSYPLSPTTGRKPGFDLDHRRKRSNDRFQHRQWQQDTNGKLWI